MIPLNFHLFLQNLSVMKFLSSILIIFIFNCHCSFARSIEIKNEQSIDSIDLKVKKLKHLYLLSTASSVHQSDVYKQEFFDEFPNTFKELSVLYGYNSKMHQPAPLYSEVEKHILNLFNNITCVNDTVYYKKIVSISLGGHWDADAVNAFQAGLRKRVVANPELIEYILKNKSDDEARSFWYFYFDGVHPKNQLPESLQRIKLIDYRGYKLMIEAQIKVLNHSKEMQ